MDREQFNILVEGVMVGKQAGTYIVFQLINFIFGCTGSSLLCLGFLYLQTTLQLQCVGFSLQWLLAAEHRLQVHGFQQLQRVASTVVTCWLQGGAGFRSCGPRALQCVAFGSCRTQAQQWLAPTLYSHFDEAYPSPCFYVHYVLKDLVGLVHFIAEVPYHGASIYGSLLLPQL